MKSADTRGELSWKTTSAPKPWKIGDPQSDTTITIPGNPSLADEVSANAEFAALIAKDLNPWIFAIKLRDDGTKLHARAYLGKPPTGSEARALAKLPLAIQEKVASLGSKDGAGAIDFDVVSPISSNRAPDLVRQITEALARDPNVLLIGPPGTGKTVALEELRSGFKNQQRRIFFDPELWEDAWKEEEREVVSLVFHPSYGYEDFVAGLLPSMNDQGFQLSARPGPLVYLSHWAIEAPHRSALLVIDEFNRGAASAIFGDALALLDNDKRLKPDGSGVRVMRPFPRETMVVEDKYKDARGQLEVPKEFGLPSSLSIVAALNSSDRSVTPLDAALRRRFALIAVPPDYEALARHFGVKALAEDDSFQPSDENPETWSIDEVKSLLVLMLRGLNDRIGLVLGSDFLLGHALLWPVSGDSTEQVAIAAAHAFDERIGAALRITFADQDEALAAILRAGDSTTQQGANISTLAGVAKWHLPSQAMQTVAFARLTILRQSGRHYTEVLRAFRNLV